MHTHPNSKISVFIADNNEVYLAGLVSIVHKLPKIHSIGSASNYREMKTLRRNLSFDLFLIDIDMLGYDPVGFIQLLKKRNTNDKIILLSSFDDVFHIKKLFKEGATGYLNKSASKTEIYTAIKSVLQGKYYASNGLKESIIQDSFKIENNCTLKNLAIDVMFLISHQFSNKQIAQSLRLSEKTIEYYRLNLFKTLGIKNMVGVGVYAVRNNIFFNSMLHKKYRALFQRNNLAYA